MTTARVQFTSEPLLGIDVVSFGHALHVISIVAADEFEYVSATHSVHAPEPLLFLYVPMLQALHEAPVHPRSQSLAKDCGVFDMTSTNNAVGMHSFTDIVIFFLRKCVISLFIQICLLCMEYGANTNETTIMYP